MEAFFILAGVAFAINKTVTVIKAALTAPRDLNMALTQVSVWVIGTAAMFLIANAGVTEALVLPGLSTALGDMDAASLFVMGWVLGSSGSFAYDLTHQNKPEPSLFPALDPDSPASSSSWL